MTNFLEKYNEYLIYFEEKLNLYFNGLNDFPKKLLDAVRYSVFSDGKRIRPVLLLAVNDMLGGKIDDVILYAIAIECVHTYSLIHDDLPSMDNDDFRRGKLSNHKKFGEDLAILAGDTLSNLAYETILSKDDFDKNDVSALKLFSNYVGGSGLIAGQVYDIFSKNDEDIDYIVQNKTAKLLTLPMLIASIKNDYVHYDDFLVLGEKLGKMFQITDDIFDKIGDSKIIGKTTNKDVDKNNYVNKFGLEKSMQTVTLLYNECNIIAKSLPNNQFLLQLIDYLYKRKK